MFYVEALFNVLFSFFGNLRGRHGHPCSLKLNLPVHLHTSPLRHTLNSRTMEKELAQRFHDLNTSSIVELRKSFNAYVGDLKNTPNLNWEVFASLLIPRHRYEEVLHVRLLRVFERQQELIDVFLQANTALNKILLKDPWFVRVIARMPPDLCPNVSYVTKQSLFYKLSFYLDEDGDAYYEAVCGKYGAKMARPLLLACGRDRLVENLGYKLNDRQLVHLHRRFPDVCQAYLKAGNVAQYASFARYLCLNDVDSFHAVLKTPLPSFGRQSFRKYLEHYKDDVVSRPHFFVDAVKKRKFHSYVYRSVSLDEYFSYFKNFVSVHKDRTDVFLRECVGSVPLRKRGTVAEYLLRNLNGIDLWSTVAFANADLLKLLPLEDRLRFDDLEDEYPEMHATSISVPNLIDELKEVCNKERQEVLCCKLIETCLINKDDEALLEVLSYFSETFFKENIGVVHEAMCTLVTDYPMEKLSPDHWSCLCTLMSNLTDENDMSHFLRYYLWRASRDNCFRNNTDVKESLINFMKSLIIPFEYALDKFTRESILAFPDVLAVVYPTEDGQILAKYHFLEWIARYNAKNPENRIDLYGYADYFATSIPQITADSMLVKELFRYEPTTPESAAINVAVLREVLSKYDYDDPEFTSVFKLRHLLQLFRRRPNDFANHMDAYFARGGNVELFAEIADMPKSKLYADLHEKSIATLAVPGGEDGATIAAFRFLSFDASFNIIAELKRHLPNRSIKIKTRLVNCVKNSRTPWRHADGVVELCLAGYAESAESTLQYVLVRSPEKCLVEPAPVVRVRRERRREQVVEEDPDEAASGYSSKIETDCHDKAML